MDDSQENPQRGIYLGIILQFSYNQSVTLLSLVCSIQYTGNVYGDDQFIIKFACAKLSFIKDCRKNNK